MSNSGEHSEDRPVDMTDKTGEKNGLPRDDGAAQAKDKLELDAKMTRYIGPDSNAGVKSREFTVMSQTEKAQIANLPAYLRPELLSRKSGFTPERREDKTFERFKPRIEELLDLTAPSRDHEYGPGLSRAESKGLSETRERLLNCDNVADALSNALHLARLYQHLRYIEEAKRATLFALGIDPDNIMGKQLLKELERVQISELGLKTSLEPSPFSKSALRNRIINLSGGKVIVVGDLLIDELVEGRPERISREAPVLVLEHVDTELIPGGAANTAHNITALGGKCHAIGVCGKDDYAPKLASVLERYGITYDLIEDESRPTTVKSRVISKSHSLLQQLLRIDRISHAKINSEIESRLIEKINTANQSFNAIIVSDYKAGVITDGVIAAVRALAENRDTMVIVDAQNSFERFGNCTLMTPNQPDAEAASGIKITSKESLKQLGELLLTKSGVKALLVTRGGDGMVLFERGKPMVELPAFNRSEVFDVTGAGDTVVATMALALTSGASMPEAMALGNLAASIVVRKPGTEVTSQKEMLQHLEQLNLPE
jgi:rfaE bifunctional protein kinase chain/domain